MRIYYLDCLWMRIFSLFKWQRAVHLLMSSELLKRLLFSGKISQVSSTEQIKENKRAYRNALFVSKCP